jgi:hypothetical protein
MAAAGPAAIALEAGCDQAHFIHEFNASMAPVLDRHVRLQYTTLSMAYADRKRRMPCSVRSQRISWSQRRDTLILIVLGFIS